MRQPLRGFLPFIEKGSVRDKKIQIALAAQFHRRVTTRARNCHSLSRKNACDLKTSALLSQFEKKAMERFKAFKLKEPINRNRTNTKKNLKLLGGEEEEKEDMFKDEMRLVDELGVDEEMIDENLQPFLQFIKQASMEESNPPRKKKKKSYSSSSTMDCYRLMTYLMDIETSSLTQHSATQVYRWLRKEMNYSLTFTRFFIHFHGYKEQRARRGFPFNGIVDDVSFSYSHPSFSSSLTNSSNSKKSLNSITKWRGKRNLDEMKWNQKYEEEDIVSENVAMGKEDAIIMEDDAEWNGNRDDAEEEKEDMKELMEMLEEEMNQEEEEGENEDGYEDDEGFKFKRENGTRMDAVYYLMMRRLEKKHKIKNPKSIVSYVLANQKHNQLLFDKCGRYRPRCRLCFGDRHHAGFSCPLFLFFHRQKVIAEERWKGKVNVDSGDVYEAVDPASTNSEGEHKYDPSGTGNGKNEYGEGMGKEKETYDADADADADEYEVEEEEEEEEGESRAGKGGRKGKQLQEGKRKRETKLLSSEMRQAYPRLNRKYNKVISFSATVPYSFSKDVPFNESFFLCSHVCNCAKAKVRPGMGSTMALKLHVMREHSTLNDFTQKDGLVNKKRFNYLYIHEKRLKMMYKEEELENFIKEKDWKWANSLNDTLLGFLASVQELALERMQIANVSELVEKITPTQLKLIGLLVEQFIKNEIKQEVKKRKKMKSAKSMLRREREKSKEKDSSGKKGKEGTGKKGKEGTGKKGIKHGEKKRNRSSSEDIDRRDKKKKRHK